MHPSMSSWGQELQLAPSCKPLLQFANNLISSPDTFPNPDHLHQIYLGTGSGSGDAFRLGHSLDSKQTRYLALPPTAPVGVGQLILVLWWLATLSRSWFTAQRWLPRRCLMPRNWQHPETTVRQRDADESASIPIFLPFAAFFLVLQRSAAPCHVWCWIAVVWKNMHSFTTYILSFPVLLQWEVRGKKQTKKNQALLLLQG